MTLHWWIIVPERGQRKLSEYKLGFGPCRAKFCRHRRKLVDIGGYFVGVGILRPELALAGVGGFEFNRVCADFGQAHCRPIVGRCWPGVYPKLGDDRQIWLGLRQSWHLHHKRPDFDHSGRARPNQVNSGRASTKSGVQQARIGLKLAKFGPGWRATNFGRIRRKLSTACRVLVQPWLRNDACIANLRY